MYNIMIARSKRDNYGTLYSFLTTTIDGVTTPLAIESKDALDARIETMLNGNYSKSDFIVVEVVDYTIDATDYTDDSGSSSSSSSCSCSCDTSSVDSDELNAALTEVFG